MSAFQKNGHADMNGYDGQNASHSFTTLADLNAGRTATDGTYYLYPQTALPDSPAQTASDQRALGSSNFYQPRSSFDSSRSSFDEYGMRKAPELKTYNPTQGSKGTPVYVFLRAEYDLLAPPRLMASLLFATRRVPARLARLETQGAAFEYCVTADAPSFAETESSTSQIQLRLQLQEQSGHDAGLVDVGYFQYTSMIASSSQEGSRKRKHSVDQGDISSYAPDDYRLATSNNFAYPQGLHSIDTDPIQRRYPHYGQTQSRYYDLAARRGAMNSSASRSFLQPPGPQSASYGQSHLMHNATGRSLALDGTISSPNRANPPLIRTSTLQQSSTGPSAGGAGSFNPYAMYPQKAVLKLRGNLNSMTEGWTPEEWTAKRRLVQFWRSQNKSTINAEFAPVKPEDRQPNSICISCIWWEERQECFATSVDTIYLLEQLVALRFTVEEKNRIRRNLEGFKPLTVAKGKPDSEEFFKVIMGFPNPKPRNIEKDVKVFEWKILAGALKKIMSKYSASYSSTAGTLPQTRGSMYGGGYPPEPGADNLTTSSSRSTSGSTASYATTQTLKSNAMSPADANHAPSHYPDQSSLSAASTLPSMGTQNGSYLSPQLPLSAHAHAQPYPDQSPLSGLSHSYPLPIERSRSSQGPTVTDSDPEFLRYAKRPRANTTAGAHIYSSSSPAQTIDHSSHTAQTPNSGQANNISNATLPLPPPTPVYATPSRSFSESQADLLRTGSISSLPSLTGSMAGEAFPLLGSNGAGGS